MNKAPQLGLFRLADPDRKGHDVRSCDSRLNGPLKVGDAQYKRSPAGGYPNADLYQLLAYAVALALPGGTLVYAADEGMRAAEHVVVHAEKTLRVVALDLFVPRSKVLQQKCGGRSINRHTVESPVPDQYGARQRRHTDVS